MSSLNRNKPSLTVVVPLFNGKTYIRETLEAILSQTIPPAEVIVVNDGSTDGSEKIATQYPVTIINQPNRGISGARNAGILAANTEWIGLCDQDDVWVRKKLEAQLVVRQQVPDVDIIFSDIVTLKNGRRIDSPFHVKRLVEACSIASYPPNMYALDGRWVCRTIMEGNPITPSTILCRRDLIAKHLFDEEMVRAEDRDLFLRMFPSSTIVYLDIPLVTYRLHETNNSLDSCKMMEGSALLAEKVVRHPSLYPDFVNDCMRHNIPELCYEAGSLALREGHYSDAMRFLGKSLRYRWVAKALMKFIFASIKRIMREYRTPDYS